MRNRRQTLLSVAGAVFAWVLVLDDAAKGYPTE
jgi:hypothetical protein